MSTDLSDVQIGDVLCVTYLPMPEITPREKRKKSFFSGRVRSMQGANGTPTHITFEDSEGTDIKGPGGGWWKVRKRGIKIGDVTAIQKQQ